MTPQELKNTILQQAIQGKLVEQRPEEGTAEELFSILQEKKNELLSAGKIYKKQPTKPFYSKCELDSFVIPETWLWVQLSDVSLIQEGAGIRKWQYRESGIQILCVTNILNGAVDLKNKELYISKEEYKEKYSHLTLNRGDIVTACSGGSWGKVAIFDDKDIVMLNTSTLRMRFWNDLCCNKYLYYICQSQFFKQQLLGQLSGMQPNFGYAHYSRILIPLPPLAEQKRIVAKIEELQPYVDRYEEAWLKLEVLNSRFPDDMKKSLLQYAIQGKLVEQRTEEGTAEELFERIQEEKQRLIAEGKIKKEKPLPEITEEEKPFEIPESWKWCYIGDIFLHNTGKAQNSTGSTKGVIRKFITTSNLYWNRFDFSKVKEMPFTEQELVRCTVKKGDLLVCEGGDCGRSAIWCYDEEVCIQNHVHRLRPYVEISIEYFYYLFYIYKFTGKLNGRGVGIQGLSNEAIHKVMLPFPPLAEQKRIVAKLEELLPLCENLKKTGTRKRM